MEKHILCTMNIESEQFFNALSHPLRLRSLLLLQAEGELCVCELIYALGVSQPMISRHLAHLREWQIVSDRRQGLWVYYRLNDELPEWMMQVLAVTAKGVAGELPYDEDQTNLTDMPSRPSAACCA